MEKRILKILSDLQPHSAKELAEVTHRFGAVIHTLRSKGYEIDTIQFAGNKPAYYKLFSLAVV
jgi:biotin operon repressor